MSRNFVAASSQYLSHPAAVVADVPITMSCWFYVANVTTAHVILSIGSDTTLGRHQMTLAGNIGGDPLRLQTLGAASGTANCDATGSYAANVWTHACAVVSGVASRACYRDGANKGTSTASQATGSFGTGVTTIGARVASGSPGIYHQGRIAEVGFWDVALDDAEVAALASRISPRRIRPANLVAYWPLWGLHSPEIDVARGLYPMTVNGGATAADHAPVVPYSSRLWGSCPVLEFAAPGATALPSLLQYGSYAGGTL
jgi:hypothetical protein